MPREETDQEDRKVAQAARATCAGHGKACPRHLCSCGTAVPPLRLCSPTLNIGVFVLVKRE